MALTDTKVKAAKPICQKCKGEKPKNDAQECEKCKGKVVKQIKLADSHGLYLLVNKSGKYWRYDYKLNNKRKTLSIGAYPSIPLAGKVGKDKIFKKGARDLVIEAKALVKAGIDPSIKKKETKQEAIDQSKQIEEKRVIDTNTFEFVARQWHKTRQNRWSPKHAFTIMSRFQQHVFPFIGSTPVAALNKTQIATVLTNIADRGTIEIAKRIGQIIKQVLEYGSDRGLIDAIPMGNIANIIPARKAIPIPAITDPVRLSELLKAIYMYDGSFVVNQALKILPFFAVRSGEFRAAEWCEFDLDGALWTIPAAHRKLNKDAKADPSNVHLVPLSTQAVALLSELHEFTGHGKYVFPSSRGDSRHMSENTVNVAIHNLGFTGMTGHGWRSVFSTTMNEQNFNPDAIERQLAHVETNSVRAAYNRSEYLPERIKMMQHWADYLDGLRLKDS